MKYYHCSNEAYVRQPRSDRPCGFIYLVPPGLRFGTARRGCRYVYSVSLPPRVLRVTDAQSFTRFINDYNTVHETDYGPDGRVDWDRLALEYDGVVFEWWESLTDCRDSRFVEHVFSNGAYEWYENLNGPCGYVWNSYRLTYRVPKC